MKDIAGRVSVSDAAQHIEELIKLKQDPSKY
jgi:hypothetical protein